MNLTFTRARMTAVIVAIAGMVSLLFSSGVGAGGPSPTISISPSFQNVAVGGQLEVDVVIDDAPVFAAYEFHLAFDLNLLEFSAVTRGGEILEETGRDALCLGPQPDDLMNGVISYACASTGGSGGPVGSGLLATLTFNTICAGQSALAFVPAGKDLSVDAVSIADPLGTSIETEGVGGDVNINGTGCPGPGVRRGDANCSGAVDAIDAALVLQKSAGLLDTVSCETNADANANGNIDSIDAALILQLVAGLLGSL